MNDVKGLATFKWSLQAGSGYSAKGEDAISAEKYGQVMAILNGTLDIDTINKEIQELRSLVESMRSRVEDCVKRESLMKEAILLSLPKNTFKEDGIWFVGTEKEASQASPMHSAFLDLINSPSISGLIVLKDRPVAEITKSDVDHAQVNGIRLIGDFKAGSKVYIKEPS